MNKKLLGFWLLCALAYTACKKDSDDAPEVPPTQLSALITKTMDPEVTDTMYFVYDSDGRVTTLRRLISNNEVGFDSTITRISYLNGRVNTVTNETFSEQTRHEWVYETSNDFRIRTKKAAVGSEFFELSSFADYLLVKGLPKKIEYHDTDRTGTFGMFKTENYIIRNNNIVLRTTSPNPGFDYPDGEDFSEIKRRYEYDMMENPFRDMDFLLPELDFLLTPNANNVTSARDFIQIDDTTEQHVALTHVQWAYNKEGLPNQAFVSLYQLGEKQDTNNTTVEDSTLLFEYILEFQYNKSLPLDSGSVPFEFVPDTTEGQ